MSKSLTVKGSAGATSGGKLTVRGGNLTAWGPNSWAILSQLKVDPAMDWWWQHNQTIPTWSIDDALFELADFMTTVPDYCKESRNFWLKVAENNIWAIVLSPLSLVRDDQYVLTALDQEPAHLFYLLDEPGIDDEANAALKRKTLLLPALQSALAKDSLEPNLAKYISYVFEDLPEAIKHDRQLLLTYCQVVLKHNLAFNCSGLSLTNFPEYLTDHQLVTYLIAIDGFSLRAALPKHQADRDLAKLAVLAYPPLLLSIKTSFLSDSALVNLAISLARETWAWGEKGRNSHSQAQFLVNFFQQYPAWETYPSLPFDEVSLRQEIQTLTQRKSQDKTSYFNVNLNGLGYWAGHYDLVIRLSDTEG